MEAVATARQPRSVTIHHGDARKLDWIPDQSVHLGVTSPPYWTLKRYPENTKQLG
ncbi:MAG: site-specific DNA-methyltransferase, partial [Acidobacteriota bacterium]|nr:site-specific DNA-methyltransferase [Acidobacteriota bacterium]